MTSITKVTCDGCGADLNSKRRLFLTAAYMVTRERDFCDQACLHHWSNREQLLAKLWREWRTTLVESGVLKDMDGGAYDRLRQDTVASIEAQAFFHFPLARPPAG